MPMSGPVLLQGIEGLTPKRTRSNRKPFTKQIKDFKDQDHFHF